MPRGLTAGDRGLLLGAGAVLAGLGLASRWLAGGTGNTAEVPTTYSAGSSGAKAAFLLLQDSGYAVTRWEQPVQELPSGAGVTLILADPQRAPAADERAAVLRFIEQGGAVIATGVLGSLFLPDRRVAAEPVAGLTWQRALALSPSPITKAAPAITLAPAAYWDSDAFAIPLYGAADRRRVVEYPYRAGRAVWWASATPLTNAGLREAGNVEFFLACLGEIDRRILWDESFHGHRRQSTSSVARWPLSGIGVQLVLLAAAVLLTHSRRSGPVVPALVERRLSPLEFVRTLGSLYHRAGAASVAVDIAYQRFTFALTRRLGLASQTSADELERAVRQRWTVDEAFGDVLRACEAARTDPVLPAGEALRLNRALHDYASALSLFTPRN
jgi:hypothetical protein